MLRSDKISVVLKSGEENFEQFEGKLMHSAQVLSGRFNFSPGFISAKIKDIKNLRSNSLLYISVLIQKRSRDINILPSVGNIPHLW